MSGEGVHNPTDIVSLEDDVITLVARQIDMLGNAGLGRAYTATLRVSPDGDNSDGLSWRTAYQTLNAALDAASTDANDLTLILMAPHATYYDINLTGTPEWAANVILQGSHRDFVEIRNTHATAEQIMELSGKSAVRDLCFHLHTDGNGLIMSGDGARIDRVRFNGTLQEDAAIALWMRGDRQKARDVDIIGVIDWTIGIKLDASAESHLENMVLHDCERGLWFGDVASDHNIINGIFLHGCVYGIYIDAGNDNNFHDIEWQQCTYNVYDEIGDSHWSELTGRFDIEILPDDLTGINVACGAAGVYGADTELLAAASRENPFRIVGVHFAPSAAAGEWYQVRFTDDSGSTFYDILQFTGNKREGIAAPSGTEHIFNQGTRISASARSVTGGNNVDVWVEVQEI